jgi:hypothetical protein
MHKKTMIYLDPEMHRQLRYMALDNRISMAELIRRVLDQFLKARPKPSVVRDALDFSEARPRVKRKTVRKLGREGVRK